MQKGWCMKNPKTILFGIVCLTCLGACLSPKAQANEWDRKTVLTFGQPVEIPGIVLPAGTYVFSFLGSTADRFIIEVLSQDEQKLYATIEAIPDYWASANGETAIIFEERKAGAPHAIKEWFFPDRRYGHQFVYPETGTLELGKETPSTEEKADMMEHSGQIPQPEETDYLRLLHQRQTEPLQLAKADEPESANKPAQSNDMSYLQALRLKQTELQQAQIPVKSATVRELPKTASHLPMAALSGILLVAISFGLRLYSKND